jgi:multicomponent Na+:H+ antiporter subunit F
MIAAGISILALGAIAVAALGVVRIVKGPTSADRVLALDLFLTAAVALAIAAAIGTGRTVYLDVAIGLALLGFVGTIGWARLIDRAAQRQGQGEVASRGSKRSGRGRP